MIFQIQRVDLCRQSHIQEFVCRIQNMCTPVTQRTHTEVIPTTPLSHVIIMVIVMMLHYPQPGIPIHCFRNRFSHRHMLDIRIPSVPTTRRVHMSGDSCYILYQTSFFPCLELEIIGFGMSLVTHLCDHAIFLFTAHHQFYFLESTRHRFFNIYMFAVGHCLDCDREMGMVGNPHRHSIDLIRHLIEHLTEILITGNFREHGDQFLRMLRPHIHIAKGYNITQSGLIQFLGNFTTPVTNANKCDINFLVRTNERYTRHCTSLRRDPKRRYCSSCR